VAPESVEECLKLAAQFRKLCMRPHHSTVPAADRYVLVKEGKPESMHQICIFRLTRVQIVEHSLFVSD
jgi:hypothetical protein